MGMTRVVGRICRGGPFSSGSGGPTCSRNGLTSVSVTPRAASSRPARPSSSRSRLAEIPLLVRDLKKRKEEAIESGDYEAAAQHRLEEKRLREEFHEAMNAWRDSLR